MHIKETLRPRLWTPRPVWLISHSRRPNPHLPFVVFLFLVGTILAASCWAVRAWVFAPLELAGNSLPAEGSSFKLNTTSVAAPPSPPPAALHQELKSPRQEVPLPVSAPLPLEPATLPELPPVMAVGPTPSPAPEVALALETPRPVLPVVAETTPPACTVFVPQRGDTPMMRNWKMLALPVVMTAALTAVPPAVTAGGEAEGSKTTVMEKLNQMDTRLEEAFKRISDDMLALKGDALVAKTRLQTAKEKLDLLDADMAKVRTNVVQMRLELNELKKRNPSTTQALYPPAADKATLDVIANRLGKLEQDLNRLNTAPRVVPAPAPGAGRLKLVNDYPEDLLFIVNGRAYRVAPNVTEVLEQMPVGPFTYEVVSPTWGLRARNTHMLAAGDTFTITAR